MFFLFLPIFLFALNINIDYGNAKKPYEILTLYNSTPFVCKKITEKKVECEFNKVPKTPVFKDSTRFFKINPKFKKKNFLIEIEIKAPFKMYSFKDNLYNNPLITPFKIKKAKKWVIIANEQFLKNGVRGLKFYYKHTYLPYIGAIDEQLNPVNIKTNSDILKYFEILKAYKAGRDVLPEINDFIQRYPKSVFLSDVLYLKLKVLMKNNDFNDVISLGKQWIKQYAYSDKMPEVLLMIGRSYAQEGFISDASYYFNRVMTDYPNTKWAYLAMIYLADQLYAMGDDKKAFAYYEKALYSTTDLNVASLAAARLAQRYMDKGDIKKAVEYYQKIYRANKEFLLKDKQKAYELAKMLASHKMYTFAIEIGSDLLKKLKKLDDLYEPLLYNLAKWSFENRDYKQALKYVEKYLKLFPYGDYSDAAKMLRDKILFNLPENNLTKKLNYINVIIKNYQGEIKQKAIVQKAKILYDMKKYSEIIKMLNQLKQIPKNIFPDKEKFIKKVLRDYAVSLLNLKKCFKAVSLIKKYHIVLNKKYDDILYECAMKARNFNLASVICNKYLDNPSDKIFIKWMKRKIEALWELGDYKDVAEGVEDLCNVMKKGCYKYRLMEFNALWQLKGYKKALKIAEILSKYKDIQNADAFIKIVRWALQNNNNLLAATYAKKIIDLQDEFKAYPYSPFVEFVYAKYTKNKKEAIKVLKDLLNRVSGEDRARALFMLANLTGEKKYLDECLKVKNSTLWKGICKDALNLF
ncbi:tetratricopeptide repeat protein [Caminibacter sp.]